MRAFIALEMPAAVKQALATLQQALRQTSVQASWTKPENLHLTLKFLGEITAARLPAIKQVCAETANQHHCLTLKLNGIGFFPNPQRPRVVWVGLAEETGGLLELQAALADRLAALGFPSEGKPFQPHLTLGRIKTPSVTRQLAECATGYALPKLRFEIGEIVLLQSQLHPGGSIYTPLARAHLNTPLRKVHSRFAT